MKTNGTQGVSIGPAAQREDSLLEVVGMTEERIRMIGYSVDRLDAALFGCRPQVAEDCSGKEPYGPPAIDEIARKSKVTAEQIHKQLEDLMHRLTGEYI